MTEKKERKQIPRKLFYYDHVEPKPATEPPLPTSEAAQNHTPSHYTYSKLTHEKIAAIRAKSTIPNAPCIDYAQPSDTFPEGFPHFVRGRDSAREYINTLFQSRIAIYDGAMGTMIQNYAKKNKLEEEEYRGERFANWTCNTKGNNDHEG